MWGGLCHQHSWEVSKGRYPVWGLRRERGEALPAPGGGVVVVVAFNLGIARTVFLSSDFCGVAWD